MKAFIHGDVHCRRTCPPTSHWISQEQESYRFAIYVTFSSLTINGAKYGSKQKRLANDDSYAKLDGNETHDDNEERKS